MKLFDWTLLKRKQVTLILIVLGLITLGVLYIVLVLR